MKTYNPNSARAAVESLLRAADTPLFAREVMADLAGTVHSVSAIATALKEGVNAGGILRLGVGRPYQYTLPEAVELDEASTTAAMPAGHYHGPVFDREPLTGTLGQFCSVSGSPGSAGQYATAEQIADRIEFALDDGIAYSVDDVVSLLGRFTRGQVVSGLHELAARSRLVSERDSDDSCTVYSLSPEEPQRTLADCKAVFDAACVLNYGPHPRISNGGFTSAWSAVAFRERLNAIATDLVDASGDACDARLSHGVIKALVTAGEAVRHARQHLEA